MFEKLFLLVKSNAGKAVINNPEVPEKYRESVITEASSSIIDVLKNQIESGKMKDLVNAFKSQTDVKPLVNKMVHKFSHRLNSYYAFSTKTANEISTELIPTVMEKLVTETKSGHDADFDLGVMFSQINGNRADLSNLVNDMLLAS